MANRILLKLGAMKGELLRYPWRALMRILQAVNTQEDLQVFYRGNPHLSFAPREIDAIQVKETKAGTDLDITLNFLGLQGASTPLPIHFSEAIIQDDPDDSSLNEFYNFFNQRIFMMLYAIEQKYAYLPQVSQEANDPLTNKLGRFAGFLNDDTGEKQLLPYLPGMLGKNLEKGSWCRMVAGFIGAEKAWVEERVATRIKIPEDCLGRLGTNSALGQTLSLGAYITQAKNHLELHLIIEHLNDFLPHQPLFQVLQELVRKTMRENMFITVVFHAKKAATAVFNHNKPMGLGWSSMLGRDPIQSYSVKLGLI